MTVGERLAALQMEAAALTDRLRSLMHAQLEADDLTLFNRLYRLHLRAKKRQERRLNAEGEYWDSVMEYLP